MWCGDPTWNDPNFGIPKNVQFCHICGPFTFYSNFGWLKIWVIPCWVTTPHGCHWLHLTNSGRQLHEWTLFIFKQYCLEGILAKESSPRTKDFLLWSDLLASNDINLNSHGSYIGRCANRCIFLRRIAQDPKLSRSFFNFSQELHFHVDICFCTVWDYTLIPCFSS